MNVIETIIAIFLLVMVVMTAIAEPVTSFKYAKAMLDSGIKVFKWCIKTVKSLISDLKNSNEKGVPLNESRF